jgi:zinc transporter 1
VFLVSLCLGIVIEAIERLFEVKEIHDPRLLLIVGFIGLFINLVGLVIFGHAHSHNIPAVIAEDSDDEEDSDSEESEIHSRNELQCTDNLINKSKNLEVESNREQDISNNESNAKIYKDLTVDTNTNGPTLLVMENIATKQKKSKSDKLNDSGNKSKKSNKSSTKCQILSKEANMNMRAVFLHVLADALGSIIVIISALLNIFRNELKIPTSVINYVDPVLCLGLVILILSSTIPLCNDLILSYDALIS